MIMGHYVMDAVRSSIVVYHHRVWDAAACLVELPLSTFAPCYLDYYLSWYAIIRPLIPCIRLVFYNKNNSLGFIIIPLITDHEAYYSASYRHKLQKFPSPNRSSRVIGMEGNSVACMCTL